MTTQVQSGETNPVGDTTACRRALRTWARAGWVVGCAAMVIGTATLFPARAYTFLGKPPYVWPHGKVSMVLKLGSPGRTLIDGNTSWDQVAAQALATWNSYLGPVQFAATNQSPGVGCDGDRINQVFFNSRVYGQFFGGGVLAVTTSWFVGTTTTEADVTFNSAISWDSYSGPLRYPGGQFLCDFHRVALHEFGHVLGLNHPEQTDQSGKTIMNSVVGDTDGLTLDDIYGVEALYPQAPSISAQPDPQTAIPGSTVTFGVAANGSLPLTYQWKWKGVDIPGATSNTYTRQNVQPTDAGTYTVTVGNLAGAITSHAADLAVNTPPAIRLNAPANGAVLLNLSGPAGKNLTVYASTDLLNWTPIATLPNPGGTVQFSDPEADKFPSRFYQSVAQ